MEIEMKEKVNQYFVLWNDEVQGEDMYAAASYSTEKDAIKFAEDCLLENGDTNEQYVIAKATQKVVCTTRLEKF